ncbi:MAG: secreted protein, partial [Bacteroidetes bacterium]|nr:secreted protein [Bacteroidota bacterium]
MRSQSGFFRSSIVLISLILIPVGSSAGGLLPETDNQDTIKSQTRQPVYTTSRLVTPRPVIDGKLDDECWKHGIWAGDYHQFIPNEGAKPSYPTELNIQYDDKYLYVAFRAFDGEPDKIVRMSGVRDETVGDMVGLTLDSYRDYRTGFEFTITAWGQKVDLVLFNPMNWDF